MSHATIKGRREIRRKMAEKKAEKKAKSSRQRESCPSSKCRYTKNSGAKRRRVKVLLSTGNFEGARYE